jgi:hypothetical protein
MKKTKKEKFFIENMEDKEIKRERADNKDTQFSLVLMLSKERSKPPLRIPYGMSYERYESAMVQYGD